MIEAIALLISLVHKRFANLWISVSFNSHHLSLHSLAIISELNRVDICRQGTPTLTEYGFVDFTTTDPAPMTEPSAI